MKIKNIILSGISLLALTACNDFLDVDAPSSYTPDFVFSQETEISRALNGVYAKAIVNNLYGDAYQNTFVLNSDVEMQIFSSNAHSKTSYARFDCDDTGGNILSFWTAAYSLIEEANKFIYNLEHSPIYDEKNSNIMQWLGEAKCLRAMAYHDLVVMFGDVPFRFNKAADDGANYTIPVLDRTAVQDSLIADLKKASLHMQYANAVTVERCSKEFAQALISRIALTAGGYSLRPDKSNPKSYGTMQRPDNYLEYYKTARDYADSVITKSKHSLNPDYMQTFIDECNYKVVNDGDAIFEFPFAKESTGNTGYLQGPEYKANEGKTVHEWGAAGGKARLNAFYRFLFRNGDARREQVNGLWYYSYFTNSEGALTDSVYIRSDYTVHNNKWSKLWTNPGSELGADKTGATGINYPYMRYADVLLMYAEADNEINGKPSAKAQECLAKVHNRAFPASTLKPAVLAEEAAYLAQAATSKEAFQKAVLDERKWEFAGENIRWRDLVRTNTYGEEIIYSFLRYYTAGVRNAQSSSGYEDAINIHDGYETYNGYIDNLPEEIYYHTYDYGEPNAYAMLMYKAQLYGNVINTDKTYFSTYPNHTFQALRIYNAYKPMSKPITSAIKRGGFKADQWYEADFYQWGDQNTGLPKDQCKYSFYGYIRCDDGGNIWLINNGQLEQLPSDLSSLKEIPAVRYILPYPNTVIQRSGGKYKNYYGY